MSPLQSPNFNPHFNFETPANQPMMRNVRNVLNSTQFLPNGSKPLGGMNLGNRRNSLALNTSACTTAGWAGCCAVLWREHCLGSPGQQGS